MLVTTQEKDSLTVLLEELGEALRVKQDHDQGEQE